MRVIVLSVKELTYHKMKFHNFIKKLKIIIKYIILNK